MALAAHFPPHEPEFTWPGSNRRVEAVDLAGDGAHDTRATSGAGPRDIDLRCWRELDASARCALADVTAECGRRSPPSPSQICPPPPPTPARPAAPEEDGPSPDYLEVASLRFLVTCPHDPTRSAPNQALALVQKGRGALYKALCEKLGWAPEGFLAGSRRRTPPGRGSSRKIKDAAENGRRRSARRTWRRPTSSCGSARGDCAGGVRRDADEDGRAAEARRRAGSCGSASSSTTCRW